ncbi:MAG: aminotransferase class I/II-fold pyridoxal phosphate-dependent enzyme [Prolixibacteraceae bacterium]|jgi:cystathionine beta-lyase/cystathionine gamma-synthase|nr:aminotransferase class I/II-fold pyridoxal phosphate-dependent enzyme [Prolixibacteraceae bacterium]MBT6998602.1 aminotransferase class I/II-fold pyridoxal phosphate-dependent enzyme [Prolixibacteraceae bacterium]MBT7396303.1 aminotransferase class I/II-fold pyridoxal phosphate-dependent enzyme [Prolixibacteraceae bacterium]
MKKELKPETMISHFAEEREKYEGAVVPPIFQNTLFTFKDWDAIDAAFDDRINTSIYSRGRNPGVNIVEKKLAKLAGGEKARLFASGMAAITAAVMHFLDAGDHAIAIKNIYGPANNLISVYLKKKMGIETTFVSGNDLDEYKNAIRPNTKLFYLESPSTAIFNIQDIESICKLARSKEIKTIIDNTWASPIFQKPLKMGVDLEIHSCSKYIGGHSDVVAGLVIGNAKDIDSISVNEFELLGGKTAPLDAWLLMRSLRTLPIRMKAHQENAIKVAQFLESHPKIETVNYPGLKSFPQHELAKKQMTGFSGLMAFKLKTSNLSQIKTFFNSLKIFKIGVSWGGHESLVYAPAISYLKELSPEQFNGLGISLGDMRISVGLEDAGDLIDDLEQALETISD